MGAFSTCRMLKEYLHYSQDRPRALQALKGQTACLKYHCMKQDAVFKHCATEPKSNANTAGALPILVRRH